MKINSTNKKWLHLNNIAFYIIVIILTILIAQLSVKTNVRYDLTPNNRHSLSTDSIDYLSKINTPITIDVFISPDNPYKTELVALVSLFQSYSTQIKVNYINPDFEPEKVREMNIQQQLEMVVSAGNNIKHVFDLSEQSLINAIISVLKQKQPWLLFIEGHGERTPFNQANFNLSILGEQLKQKGYKLHGLNLASTGSIPQNTATLIIASPERPWLEGEIKLVQDYIRKGGNLLWLNDPDNTTNLAPLAKQLGITFSKGTIIDPNAKLLGINDPTFTLITDYADHPVGRATQSATLFPKASAIEQISDSNWTYTPLLSTAANTWLETSPLSITPSYDSKQDIKGPLTLAYLLSSPQTATSAKKNEQRIAIIGDGDFLANSYIGNGGNLDLGIALVNWLASDQHTIAIPVKLTLDKQLELTRVESLFIGLGFLVILPLLLALIGFIIWFRRRKK